MISRIDLDDFKCFGGIKLPLLPLTLLSGTNASGKSSVMQALALLQQTMRENEWSSRLLLNGDTVRLGTAADVINQKHGRNRCGVTIVDNCGDWVSWEFGGKRRDMSMSIHNIRGGDSKGDSFDTIGSEPLHFLMPFSSDKYTLVHQLRGLTYLTAERLGPREHYLHDDPEPTAIVGPRGEHAVSMLHSGRNRLINGGLSIDDDAPPTRFRQVEAWMAQFFPGCVLEVSQVPRTNSLTLGISLSFGFDFHRPANTGFGITQVLPILVAALSASENSILLIENPEVHLHPAAQAGMGVFLSHVAASGVQVIVETHSDHILNGIRRTVKVGAFSHEDVMLHFFKSPQAVMENADSQVESPVIDATGNLDYWPEGFFDQFDYDMNDLIDWT